VLRVDENRWLTAAEARASCQWRLQQQLEDEERGRPVDSEPEEGYGM